MFSRFLVQDMHREVIELSGPSGGPPPLRVSAGLKYFPALVLEARCPTTLAPKVPRNDLKDELITTLQIYYIY